MEESQTQIISVLQKIKPDNYGYDFVKNILKIGTPDLHKDWAIADWEEIKNILEELLSKQYYDNYTLCKVETEPIENTTYDDKETKTMNGRNAFIKITEQKKELFCKGSGGDVPVPLFGIQTPPDDNCLFHALSMGLTQTYETLKDFQFQTDTQNNFPIDKNVLREIPQNELQQYLRYCLSSQMTPINPDFFGGGRDSWGTDEHIGEFTKAFKIPIFIVEIQNYNEPAENKKIQIQYDPTTYVTTPIYPPIGLINYTNYHFELAVYEEFQPLQSLFPEFVIFQLQQLGKKAMTALRSSEDEVLDESKKTEIISFIEIILRKLE